MQIFKMPKFPFDFHFATDKTGHRIIEFIDDRICNATNRDAVKKFVDLVKKYINKEI